MRLNPIESMTPNATAATSITQPLRVHWTEANTPQEAQWRSESGATPPKRVIVGDDSLSADTAYRYACEGTGILWRGDFQNARQLLAALVRRVDKKRRKPVDSMRDAFNQHRQIQSQRARILGMLLLPLSRAHSIPLRRAPDVSRACLEAYGPVDEAYVVSLRELQGIIGAHEWRKKGVDIPALGASIHPHYGVFSPVRGEYIDLLARAPLPAQDLAFDIGVGSGIVSALLLKRGVQRVIATDLSERALDCARENLQRLGYINRVELQHTDLFPAGKASLIVCNPPWLPARPSSVLEQAVYDTDSRMLRGFLNGLVDHLTPTGQAWLILSDLAEHLELRSRDELLAWITQAGLIVADKMDIKPRHSRALDADDPLHTARAAEITSLWCLKKA